MSICISAALTAWLLPMAAMSAGLEDLVVKPNAEAAATEQAAKEDVEQRFKAAKAKAEADMKAAAEKAAAEKAAAEKAAAEKAAAEKAAAEKAAAEKAAAEKAAAEKAAAEKAAAEKAERERELKQLREKVAEERRAREAAEQAQKTAEQAQKTAEKRAEYLANPDPDERPEPKKRLEAKGDQRDVIETIPNVVVEKQGETVKKPKKQLTGRAAVITADRTDYDRKEGVILFDRNVYVDDEQYQMRAERLFVFLDGTNDLKRLVAIGNVTLTNDSKSASCARAVYTKAASRIVLYGDDQHPAGLRDAGSKPGDASEVQGARITYWLDSGVATVEKSVVKLPGVKGGAKDLFDVTKQPSKKKAE